MAQYVSQVIIYGARHRAPSRESATTVRLFQDVTQQMHYPALIFDMENRLWNTLSVGKGSTICCMAMTQHQRSEVVQGVRPTPQWAPSLYSLSIVQSAWICFVMSTQANALSSAL